MSVRTLVVGDSWASAVEADTGRDAGWPEIMGADYRQGVRGSTAAQWAGDFEGRLTKAKQTAADAVVISLLGNDARAALRDGALTVQRLQDDAMHLGYVVQGLIRPKTVVLLYASPFGDAKSIFGVWALNYAIMEACKGLPVVFANTGLWLTADHFDGRDIHPTRAGHAVLAERMRDLCAANDQVEFSEGSEV